MELSNNPVKHEELIKQYLRSILDISGMVGRKGVLRTLVCGIEHQRPYFPSHINTEVTPMIISARERAFYYSLT